MTTRTGPQYSGRCGLLPAGADWDAIRVPRTIGLTTLEILGSRSGAVVDDAREPALYWFVAPGTAAGWEVEQTHPLGVGDYLAVPPPRRVKGPGPCWRISPGDRSWFTDADDLRAAVEDALNPGTERTA
ncbi:hypothetical protein [Streptomyces sp. NBC_01465]|uniref:hypothetical protein n=1 Tax=Streptomyces sp. NBC_01465 TaxID=2903878 RepID=UPI002E33FC20|nr:hypothetical protein [Streptomyces sp. NBC_01465]